MQRISWRELLENTFQESCLGPKALRITSLCYPTFALCTCKGSYWYSSSVGRAGPYHRLCLAMCSRSLVRSRGETWHTILTVRSVLASGTVCRHGHRKMAMVQSWLCIVSHLIYLVTNLHSISNPSDPCADMCRLRVWHAAPQRPWVQERVLGHSTSSTVLQPSLRIHLFLYSQRHIQYRCGANAHHAHPFVRYLGRVHGCPCAGHPILSYPRTFLSALHSYIRLVTC